MRCPACGQDVPTSFRCRQCGADLMARTVAPRPAESRPPRRAAPPLVDDSLDDPNPYAAPAAPAPPLFSPRSDRPIFDSAYETHLATRWSRLVANLLNGFFFVLWIAPGVLIVIVGAMSARGDDSTETIVAMVGWVGVLVGGVACLAYQVRLLAREGQTWGKRQMKIRIVSCETGEIPGLSRSFLLRELVSGAIGALPYVGGIYNLVDSLLIFGEERRCLHDHLAGTRVVTAE